MQTRHHSGTACGALPESDSNCLIDEFIFANLFRKRHLSVVPLQMSDIWACLWHASFRCEQSAGFGKKDCYWSSTTIAKVELFLSLLRIDGQSVCIIQFQGHAQICQLCGKVARSLPQVYLYLIWGWRTFDRIWDQRRFSVTEKGFEFIMHCRNYSRELQTLIHWMLEKKPAIRPSMHDVLSHPSISARLQIYQMKEEHR